MKTIEVDFEIDDEVEIIAHGIKGYVNSIKVDITGSVFYTVEYVDATETIREKVAVSQELAEVFS